MDAKFLELTFIAFIFLYMARVIIVLLVKPKLMAYVQQPSLSLGDRMKQYEHSYETTIDRDQWLVIRVDGHSFSKFTRDAFKGVFNEQFYQLMKMTSEFLMEEFKPRLVYCQSDEITLVFPPCNEKQDSHMFKGRCMKIASVIAGFASSAFIINSNQLLINDPTSLGSIRRKVPHFDGRVFGLPSAEEVYNCIMWRQRDWIRNSISMYAGSVFGKKEIHCKNSAEMLEHLKDTDKDWNNLEYWIKYGLLLKLEQFRMEETNAIRTRTTQWKPGKIEYDQSLVEKLTSKYLCTE